MNDLAVLHHSGDAAEAKELRVELLLLGARLSLEPVADLDGLHDRITRCRRSHSAVLVLITARFAKAFLESGRQLEMPPAVLPLCFGVDVALRKELADKIDGLVGTRSRSIKGYSIEVLRELGSDDREIELAPARSFEQFWESPLFLYRKIEGFDEVREILIDVTWSAKPIQRQPAETVLSVFRQAFEHIPKPTPRADGNGRSRYKILDFGAGKLRYSLFWLGKGHEVTAVDYPEPFERPTAEIVKAVDKAKRYSKRGLFDRVVYPSQLLALDGDFDVALLVNVLNIVPDPLERLFILAQCHGRLSEGGHLVVFNTYGDLSQLEQASDPITDGACTRQKGRKTFYKNLRKEELVRICELMGFSLNSEPRFQRDKNIACLFRKARAPSLDIRGLAAARDDVLGRKVVFGEHDSERVIADVLDSERWGRLGEFLSHSLDITAPGKKGAYRYEDLIHRVIEYVFHRHFKGATIEEQYEIARGRQRIDIKANWRENTALKTVVTEEYKLESSFVPIECKNYTGPLKNPEYAQVVNRCSRRWRRFGMIFCREMQAPETVLDHCSDRWKDHEYLIVVFDDADVKAMLRMADRAMEEQEEEDPVVDYVRQRIEAVVDR